jgi:hypothetical protein
MMFHFVRSDAGDAATDSGKMDLPAAAHGFEQWIGVVDKALSFQGQDKTKALESFKQSVLSHFNKQVHTTAFSKFQTVADNNYNCLFYPDLYGRSAMHAIPVTMTSMLESITNFGFKMSNLH